MGITPPSGPHAAVGLKQTVVLAGTSLGVGVGIGSLVEAVNPHDSKRSTSGEWLGRLALTAGAGAVAGAANAAFSPTAAGRYGLWMLAGASLGAGFSMPQLLKTDW
jgi:hypothetical protein